MLSAFFISPYNNPLKKILLLSSFYGWKNWAFSNNLLMPTKCSTFTFNSDTNYPGLVHTQYCPHFRCQPQGRFLDCMHFFLANWKLRLPLLTPFKLVWMTELKWLNLNDWTWKYIHLRFWFLNKRYKSETTKQKIFIRQDMGLAWYRDSILSLRVNTLLEQPSFSSTPNYKPFFQGYSHTQPLFLSLQLDVYMCVKARG